MNVGAMVARNTPRVDLDFFRASAQCLTLFFFAFAAAIASPSQKVDRRPCPCRQAVALALQASAPVPAGKRASGGRGNVRSCVLANVRQMKLWLEVVFNSSASHQTGHPPSIRLL